MTSVRLSDELLAELDHLAAMLDRPRAWLLEQAIARYVEEEATQITAIREALDDYRAGKATLKPHDEVMAETEGWIRARAEDASPLG